MRNGRCRMHGGSSTGPRTAEGLEVTRWDDHPLPQVVSDGADLMLIENFR